MPPRAALAAVAVAALLPRVSAGSHPGASCVTLPPALTRPGLHLDLVQESALCALGQVDVGPALTHTGGFVLVVCLTMLSLSLVGVAGAIGVGAWARAQFRRARDWVRRALRPLRPVLPVVAWPAPALEVVFLQDRRASLVSRVPRRRGPPLPVLA